MAKLGVFKNNYRLVILEDIVRDEKGADLTSSLEVDTHVSPSKEQPETCSECGSDDITGVQVMGSIDDIIFWECDECDEVMLRFPLKKTEELLQLAKGLWTNPIDWGYVPRSEFN